MALFYITGTSGSGKSSVQDTLQLLGYRAYDTDESINEWHDRETGKVVTFVRTTPEATTRWVQEHDFLMLESKIRELYDEAESVDIFICGHASNDIELMGYFAKVFCLFLDEEETKHRLTSRRNNNWGNSSEQLEMLMKWYKPMLERYERVGAIMVDAARPIQEVVDDILEQSKRL